jgi:tripartite-type tricarboxylate transporter receptor subunit TctC
VNAIIEAVMATRREFISLVRGGILSMASTSIPFTLQAQTSQNVARLLVGFGAGGAIDVTARMLVDVMKDYAKSFIVENRPGAGGRLALGVLKASSADGLSMILTPASNITIFPHVYKTLAYDPLRDFTPISTVCSFPFLITAGPLVPPDVKTLTEFVAWCRANPKKATYGTAAAGSMLHFTGVKLAKAANVEFVHLPYGGPNGIQDLMGGRIAATIYPIGTALPYVQSGAIRALATTGPVRSASLPDTPTVREAGYPALEATEWFGVFVPAGTPAETVQRLNKAIRDAVDTDQFRSGAAKLSIDAGSLTASDFAQLIKSDFERWGPIVQASGFSPED